MNALITSLVTSDAFLNRKVGKKGIRGTYWHTNYQ